MTRDPIRWFRLAAALACAAVVVACSNRPTDPQATLPRQKQQTTQQQKQPPPARPMNVLFLMSDDLRTEIGSYGNAQIKTPNLDALAAVSVQFDRAFVQYPLCNPSRTSMLTGRYPATTGVFDNTVHFRGQHPDWVTLPQHFKNNGYTTARCGKVFHGTMEDPPSWNLGVEQPEDPAIAKAKSKEQQVAERAKKNANSDQIVKLEGNGESHKDYKTADEAIAFMEQLKDKPFFLACGFNKPHSPPTAPTRFFDLYDPSSIQLPPTFAARPAAPAGFPERSIVKPNSDLFIDRDASEAEAREVIRAYWASVSWVDWNVGRVMTALDRLGLRDHTIVVFWGDHGYHLGEFGKWAKHQSLFEIGDRVPLYISVPGTPTQGQASRRIVECLDLYPTLVELCGLPAPAGIEGRSLVPLLTNPEAEWNHPAYTYAGQLATPAISVRNERYRYAEWKYGTDGRMLIDEQNDSHERTNLVDDPASADVREEMKALLDKAPKPKGNAGAPKEAKSNE